MTLLVFYILLAIGVSFLCSILEAVLLSISPAYVASIGESRPKVAEILSRLKKEIDRPLAAILSLNTVAHTVGAAGAGAQAAFVFGDSVIAIFSAILTLAILVFSEIIPKTIGATYWKSLAPVTARILPVLIVAMWPLVKLSQGITWMMGGAKEGAVSRSEIAAMADVGAREGVVQEGESRVVRNLLQFDRLTASDIMTPRTVVYALQEDTRVGDVLGDLEELRFTRIPVYGEGIDDITGFVLKTDLLSKALQNGKRSKISSLKRELVSVPQTMHLQELLQFILSSDSHLALVRDEYGGTAGVVSLEDVVETLLGLEIVDEADAIEDLQLLARQQWEERAKKAGIRQVEPD